MSHLARLVAQAAADARARSLMSLPEPPPLRAFPRSGVIAEVKRKSPSRGDINAALDPAQLAGAYERGGAACVSVLTDRAGFGGSLDDLRAARAAVKLPVLRKDFITLPFQIHESRAHGADAVLLIAGAAVPEKLLELRKLARDVGLAVLFEVHAREELDVAAMCAPDLLGINARDLRTLEVRPQTFAEIAPHTRGIAPLVAESGVKSAEDARRYRALGAAMLLVGEAVSSAADPEGAVRALVSA